MWLSCFVAVALSPRPVFAGPLASTIDLGSDVADAPGHHTVTVTGSFPPGPSILYAYRVPEPKAFAEAAFSRALVDAGVTIVASASPAPSPAPSDAPSGPYSVADVIAKHVSPPGAAKCSPRRERSAATTCFATPA